MATGRETARLRTGRLATVFGGSGFVGRHTVRALARHGFRIRAAVRRPDLAGHLQPMGAVGQIHAVQANLRYPEVGRPRRRGRRRGRQPGRHPRRLGPADLRCRARRTGARAVAQAARAAGVRQLVHVSAIGADPQVAGPLRPQQGARARPRCWPSFPMRSSCGRRSCSGRRTSSSTASPAWRSCSPLLPLIGGGKTKFQPVFVGDVAEAIAAAVEGRAQPGTHLRARRAGGGDLPPAARQDAATGRAAAAALSAGAVLARQAEAILTWPLPNAVRPLTVDQVRMLQVDNVVSAAAETEGRTLAGLGITAPHSAERSCRIISSASGRAGSSRITAAEQA